MKSIKILTLGNSYSNDACAWLEKILKSASYDDVIIGYINYGGCDINDHWSNVDDDITNDFGAEFFVNNNGKMHCIFLFLFCYIFNDELYYFSVCKCCLSVSFCKEL